MKNQNFTLPLLMLLGTLAPAYGGYSEDRPPEKMPSVRMRASDIIGKRLGGDRSVSYGRIIDFLVATDGRIGFLLCERNTDGSTGTEFLVPADLLTWEMGTGFRFIDPDLEQRQSDAPGLSSPFPSRAGAFPARPDIAAARSFWGGAERNGNEPLVPASELIGIPVTAGTMTTDRLEDLMIDLEEWIVVYAAVAPTSVLGSEPIYSAVPFQSLSISGNGGDVSIVIREGTMKRMPAFNDMNWPAEIPPVRNGKIKGGR